MFRWKLPLFLIALAAAACGERDLPTTTGSAMAAVPTDGAAAARERLAARLAVALRDPAVRASLKHKLDRSRAVEHKLQFQALAHADQTLLLAGLVRGGGTVADVLRELKEARHLEIYLPVESHRAAWSGDDNILVATAGSDAERPVAFDARGGRHILDADRPPRMPVLALVPQETDFTGGRPELQMSCWDYCDEDTGGGGGASGGGGGGGGGSWGATMPGLYLTASHFEESFESWIKGKPEYEYHVYGIDSKGDSEQLACTGEHAGGAYIFDQNDRDWSGAAMLLSDGERVAYDQRSGGAPIRILALEDDDEACVARVEPEKLEDVIRRLDEAYKALTSGKVDPALFRGLRISKSAFSLFKSLKRFITTADDFIGTAIETSVAGPVPAGASWVIKADGARTNGWFDTQYRR